MTAKLSWLITAVLGVIAAAAVAITVPNAVTSWRLTRSGPEPLAPGLAALSTDQLAELLPKQADFPAGWIIKADTEPQQGFGYFAWHKPDRMMGFKPEECATVIGVADTGDMRAAEVSGQNPARASEFADISLTIGREYNPAGFDDMIALISRCLRSTATTGPFQFRYTVAILEDTHPTDGPQRFRYSVTTHYPGPDAKTHTEYYSYARVSQLVLSGSGSDGHQQLFDPLFDDTLRRIRVR
ncbi:hypothetical protein [Mycobacterium talmoniae]|uniref:DUF5642 domain-containing protein n=1 Tax=Mycobacterium talmoniae TaxID=1858794 RepID=A0A1S1NH32_9MYCO|nr:MULTISPECIES: hypothetical protein [Mycobacterium]OHV02524.1 hypothetical protein BKN37_15885 [Mycobacterium talmoniae]PQM44202.1 hypothetical protein C1Y40_05640 [Mycobacterium talmoniae]TDH56002.1 hypothetical protein E2F47_08890 [Mycobacterium eburneum]